MLDPGAGAAPTPHPRTGMQTLVTRRTPTPAFRGALNPGQAVTVEEAIRGVHRQRCGGRGLGAVVHEAEAATVSS